MTGSCDTCINPCLGGLRQVAAPGLEIACEEIREPGSTAEVMLERSGFTRSCALVFGLPLLGLLAGTVVGDWLAEQVGNAAAAHFGAVAGITIAVLGGVAQRRSVQRWIMLGLGEATQHSAARGLS